jgi:hypothetical protein
MLCRSTCPIVSSCLNVIADGLELIFDTKTDVSDNLTSTHDTLVVHVRVCFQVSSDIECLFVDEKKHFSSFNVQQFHLSSSGQSSRASNDSRCEILADDTAIDCLVKLYQFYEMSSEPVSRSSLESLSHLHVVSLVHLDKSTHRRESRQRSLACSSSSCTNSSITQINDNQQRHDTDLIDRSFPCEEYFSFPSSSLLFDNEADRIRSINVCRLPLLNVARRSSRRSTLDVRNVELAMKSSGKVVACLVNATRRTRKQAHRLPVK